MSIVNMHAYEVSSTVRDRKQRQTEGKETDTRLDLLLAPHGRLSWLPFV